MKSQAHSLDRRQFLTTVACLASTAALPGCSNFFQEQWLVSTSSDKDGNYFGVAVDSKGQLMSKVKLPKRGHDSLAIPHKPGHAFIFARRPDRYAMEVDFKTGRVVKSFESQEDSHFFGHGALSKDGRYLFTTENLYDKGQGMIVVRDTDTYQVLDRFYSGGVGPHELALMPDGKTLVIANGGILTHPDWPRMKLNIKDMQPNLAYMDSSSGKLLSSYKPPHHQQSLRHLTVREDGKVFVGAQFQGPKQQLVPLVYSHHGEEQLTAFEATDQQWRNMNQYTASLSVSKNLLAISCPRGGKLTLWHADEHRCLEQREFEDVAGLSLQSGLLTASSGKGTVRQFSPRTTAELKKHQVSQIRFDNHMTAISV